MNVANDNFSTLWSALGFVVEWYGTVSPEEILAAIHDTPGALAVRGPKEKEFFGIVGLDPGIDLDRVRSYFDRLTSICREALKRGSLITWG
jgi:hypothetical protein